VRELADAWSTWPLCFGLDEGLLLATSSDGRLGLLVAEGFAISMWTLAKEGSSSAVSSSPARWTRQVVIRRQAIAREAVEGPSYSVRFMGFGERSGAVRLQIQLQHGDISQAGSWAVYGTITSGKLVRTLLIAFQRYQFRPRS
jgi:hypothetical protein